MRKNKGWHVPPGLVGGRTITFPRPGEERGESTYPEKAVGRGPLQELWAFTERDIATLQDW